MTTDLASLDAAQLRARAINVLDGLDQYSAARVGLQHANEFPLPDPAYPSPSRATFVAGDQSRPEVAGGLCFAWGGLFSTGEEWVLDPDLLEPSRPLTARDAREAAGSRLLVAAYLTCEAERDEAAAASGRLPTGEARRARGRAEHARDLAGRVLAGMPPIPDTLRRKAHATW